MPLKIEHNLDFCALFKVYLSYFVISAVVIFGIWRKCCQWFMKRKKKNFAVPFKHIHVISKT